MTNKNSSLHQAKHRPTLFWKIKSEWSGFSSNKKLSFCLFILPVCIIFVPILWKNWTANWIVIGINNIKGSWLQDLLDAVAWALFRGNIKNGISVTSIRFYYPYLISMIILLSAVYIILSFIIYFPQLRRSIIKRSHAHLEVELKDRSSLSIALLVFPIVAVLLTAILLSLPNTQPFAYLMLRENYPVEQITFLFLLFGSFQGFSLAVKNRKANGHFLLFLFYLIFSLGFFILGMEEISWGQQILKFKTPDFFLSNNRQNEFNIHNLRFINDRDEYFRIIFALVGLAGLGLKTDSRFGELRVPFFFTSWFILILVVSAAYPFFEYLFPFEKAISRGFSESAEVLEMLIGISGFLYLWIINKRLENNQY